VEGGGTYFFVGCNVGGAGVGGAAVGTVEFGVGAGVGTVVFLGGSVGTGALVVVVSFCAVAEAIRVATKTIAAAAVIRDLFMIIISFFSDLSLRCGLKQQRGQETMTAAATAAASL